VGVTINSSQPFPGSASITHSALPVNSDSVVFDFPLDTFSGVGWTYSPTGSFGPSFFAASFSFAFPAGTLTDLAHLPLSAGLVSRGAAIGFGPGEYIYPGGTYHGGEPNEQIVDVTSLTVVPEPTTLLLSVLGCLTLVAWARITKQPENFHAIPRTPISNGKNCQHNLFERAFK
jgi:hypothetical protein